MLVRRWRLPGGLAADLDLSAEAFIQLVEDGALLRDEVGFFLRVEAQIIEFLRSEGVVLKQLPVAVAEGVDGFAAVGDTALAADEI